MRKEYEYSKPFSIRNILKTFEDSDKWLSDARPSEDINRTRLSRACIYSRLILRESRKIVDKNQKEYKEAISMANKILESVKSIVETLDIDNNNRLLYWALFSEIHFINNDMEKVDISLNHMTDIAEGFNLNDISDIKALGLFYRVKGMVQPDLNSLISAYSISWALNVGTEAEYEDIVSGLNTHGISGLPLKRPNKRLHQMANSGDFMRVCL